jgi:hypothetical protein
MSADQVKQEFEKLNQKDQGNGGCHQVHLKRQMRK